MKIDNKGLQQFEFRSAFMRDAPHTDAIENDPGNDSGHRDHL